jgi:hypothetical protein
MCGYKSVKEVMENCPDFLKVTEASSVFVDPVLNILKENDKPLLYFILDSKAITQVPINQINFMKSSLRSIFDVGGVDGNSLGGLAIFPGRNGEVQEELISWTPIVQKVNDFRM